MGGVGGRNRIAIAIPDGGGSSPGIIGILRNGSPGIIHDGRYIALTVVEVVIILNRTSVLILEPIP